MKPPLRTPAAIAAAVTGTGDDTRENRAVIEAVTPFVDLALQHDAPQHECVCDLCKLVRGMTR